MDLCFQNPIKNKNSLNKNGLSESFMSASRIQT